MKKRKQFLKPEKPKKAFEMITDDKLDADWKIK